MRVFDGIADLESAVGAHLGYSDWHPVTQEQIDAFAKVTGDHQWIHSDPTRAAAGPFGTTIAHGYLTLSLVPVMLDQVFTINGLGMQVNYGADRLRFPSVVPVDSRIRAGVELLAVKPVALGHQVRVRVTIEREGAQKPVCVIDVLRVAAP
jgi:acyl dehydratase